MPPLLILGGVSGAGMTTLIQQYRPFFMVVTFGFLAVAFYLTYRPRFAAASGTASGDATPTENNNSGPSPSAAGRSRAKIMTFNKIMLWAVTVIAIVFLFFPQTMTNLFASPDQFSADMDRTVISIEGMT